MLVYAKVGRPRREGTTYNGKVLSDDERRKMNTRIAQWTVEAHRDPIKKAAHLAARREWYSRNKEKINSRAKLWRGQNSEKLKERRKQQWSNSDKKAQKERVKQWHAKNPGKRAEYNREYKEKNPGITRAKKRTEEYKAVARARYAERYATDLQYRIRRCLQARLRSALRSTKGKKVTGTLDLLGINLEGIKLHIEKQFQEGMTWGNYGEWHLDHIRPCASFDLRREEDQKACFHYTNLQPLWRSHNFAKNSYYDGVRHFHVTSKKSFVRYVPRTRRSIDTE